MGEIEAGAAGELGPGTVVEAGAWAVGNVDGDRFAVSRRCRHLGGNLADGTIDEAGCLVCPWHHAAYDVSSGRMVRGPQGVFAKIPGFGAMEKALTTVVPLRRAKVAERDGKVYVGGS